jgi:two-component system, sensor histidine kinase
MTDNIDTTSTSTLTLLFLDNSRTTRAVMSLFLGKLGFSVTAVGTGPEAIEKVKNEHFDIAIFDLYMPFMNGYEAAKHIRSLNIPNKDIPIIALTASTDPRDIDVCKNAGMDEFIIKSEDNKNLIEVLERYKAKILKDTPQNKPSPI